jgi:DNA modification methylase
MFPPKLLEPSILAGCPVDGTVLDPFVGAGTTGLVADRFGRDAILIELNPDYCEMAAQRIRADAPLLPTVITGVEGRFARHASSSHMVL